MAVVHLRCGFMAHVTQKQMFLLLYVVLHSAYSNSDLQFTWNRYKAKRANYSLRHYPTSTPYKSLSVVCRLSKYNNVPTLLLLLDVTYLGTKIFNILQLISRQLVHDRINILQYILPNKLHTSIGSQYKVENHIIV